MARLTTKEIAMKPLVLVIAVASALLCSRAFAQVGTVTAAPSIGATSPLGMSSGMTVGPTGIPMGSTEIVSPGVSPASTSVTGSISMPGLGTTCATSGTAPAGMFGSTSSFDGGGMAAGSAAPATAATSEMPISSAASASSGMSATSGIETAGMSGMCGSGSGSIASSSTPASTTPITPGGAARTGIPLGSTEIGNLGVSSAAAVPTLGVSPIVGSVGSSTVVPTMPSVTSMPTASPAPAGSTQCSTPGPVRLSGNC